MASPGSFVIDVPSSALPNSAGGPRLPTHTIDFHANRAMQTVIKNTVAAADVSTAKWSDGINI